MVSFYRRLDSSVITSLIRLADKGEKSWVVGRKKHVKKLHIIRTRLALKKKTLKNTYLQFSIKKLNHVLDVLCKFIFACTQLL